MSYEFQPSQDTEPELTPEKYLEDQKRAIRKKSAWAVGIGGFLVLAHVGWLAVFALLGADVDLTVLFRSIIFVLGLFALIAGIFGFRYAHKLSLDDIIPSQEAVEFVQSTYGTQPYYTWILIASILAVFVAQMTSGLEASIEAAGFVKADFRNGEYWRVLTGGALHGGLLHIYFNSQALYGFGALMEALSNRAHVAIVFLLAVVGGGLLSFVFMPGGTSVGASGGIMGLIGFMAIYAYRRREQLPPDFLKTMLINVGFIAAFGLIAYQLVDNFAHLGGFIVGVIYALVQVPRDLSADPRPIHPATAVIGIIAIAIYIAEAIFAIFRITENA